MKFIKLYPSAFISAFLLFTSSYASMPERLVRLPHNTPEATVDLGVGLWGWPFPHDVTGNGLPDLIVVAGSSPYRGTYFFENTGEKDPKTGMDLFEKAVRLGHGQNDLTPSYLPDGSMVVLGPGLYFPDFLTHGADRDRRVDLPIDPGSIHPTSGRIRGQQWSYVDFNGNGVLDLVVGIGDWTDYGWDNAFDENGRWTNGPLHGFVYILENTGTNEEPVYAEPYKLHADGRAVNVFGMPSPVFADFRGTGKLDLICGEFVDGLTFFENIGTRTEPKYAPGRRLKHDGNPITMHLQMIVVTAFDWTGNGLPDLVVAQEDGRVALLENTGEIIQSEWRSSPSAPANTVNMPAFNPPQFFRQKADEVKFGVLNSPSLVDWDGNGKLDIITGNAAGEIAVIRNLGGDPVQWDEPELLKADGRTIRFMAGYNGSIQGPAESKWGYINLSTGDWNGNGLTDIIVSDITGRVTFFENIGTETEPVLARGESLRVWWDGAEPTKPSWNWWDPEDDELVVSWRCTPAMVHLPGEDGMALVTVDHEGYMAIYRQEVRNGEIRVLPGERIFKMRGPSSFNWRQDPTGPLDGLLRMNDGYAGRSGRRTFIFYDWNGNGKLDLLVNSVNINFLENVSETPGEWVFQDRGPIDGKRLAGHSTAPAIGDWVGDGKERILIGAEDGFFYIFKND